jgi:flagellar basal-body rod protein FlgG
MIRSLYTSATGMNAQQLNIDVIANNLANVNTTGFKRGKVNFQDLLYQVAEEPGAPTSQNSINPSGIQIGLGVEAASVSKIFTQGDLTATNNQLDIAIEGDGFFQITLPDGTNAYSRAGAFQLDQDGQLVTPMGFPTSPAITISPTAVSVTIGQDGTISTIEPGDTAPSEVGQLQLVRFQNPSGLKAIGQNLFTETIASGTPTTGSPAEEGYGRLNQGYLETSNVSVVDQVVNMIVAQRAYEANSKGVQTSDNVLEQAINLKR